MILHEGILIYTLFYLLRKQADFFQFSRQPGFQMVNRHSNIMILQATCAGGPIGLVDQLVKIIFCTLM
mgnify:CR=1 FL=1